MASSAASSSRLSCNSTCAAKRGYCGFDPSSDSALRNNSNAATGSPAVIAINPAQPSTDAASLGRYGVGVLLMANVGHFPMLEDPARFNTILRTAIDNVPR